MKKSNDREMALSRRSFIRQSACATLGVTGLVNTLAQLTLTRSALAQVSTFTDYRAMVVLFLYGGNDSNNMLLPRMDHPAYDNYKNNRGALRILDNTDPSYVAGQPASVPLGGEGNYAVHPSLGPLATLYNSGELAFIANVGTLAFPITRAQYLSKSVAIPPQLFSHSDQQVEWQSSVPDKPFQTGWGGRVADLLRSRGYSGDKVSMSVTISGINSFQVGNNVVQYTVSPNGSVALAGFNSGSVPYGNAMNADGTYKTNNPGRRLKAFDDISQYVHENLLEEGYANVVRRARASEAVVSTAFTAAAQNGINLDAIFAAATTSLGSQLKTIAKLIAGREAIGNHRQIFFCSVGGYDTHADQLSAHDALMKELANSLDAFSKAMIALNQNDNVLLLTHSDFTRTFTPNGADASAGSDHGWGGHHIVMGGPVNGGKIYGTFPSLKVGADQDVDANRGRWIPTTSVDQYAAAAARWLGVDSGSLGTIFPNLSRFDDPFGTAAHLGFVNAG
ncbi:MAG: DUF1501 domain-containing protein [Terrimicrobiaceae bacterium]|nr:DUF1501 domain-containing protein [Terrimicrobiaceae bacterium]